MNSIIQEEFQNHIITSQKSLENLSNEIEIAAKICIETLKKNGKIILFGNGGSAADAQHIAAELVGRYMTERKGLAAIALTTDSSILTSIGNDYGYEEIFSRQIEALANTDDVVIGISTGGTSKNVINAMKLASAAGCNIIGFSGKDGGIMNEICDVNIVVPSNQTPRIQEMHILIGHTLCHLIDYELTN
ncbi:D-sedoheptulose 7-phosphate isomerase [Candidatus Pseudothioglobus singularis]|jgi:D-sedoheptulose 7-phosphate isomerase|nr:D-sedoheptulose 7-phosphate isomerase [Candidatus Pseudothioglobus singularis]MDC3216802.1 D-sedoheptulose 7-phosphate isomerase [Candidatus Pseudothioglobus singularis]